MIRPIHGLIVALGAILLQGCRPDFTEESRAVGSMLGVLGRIEEMSAEVDARLIRQYAKDVNEKCGLIQKELKDTIGLEQAETLVKFCGLSDHLRSCLERKERIDKEILETRNQLYNLRTDLSNRVANKDSVDAFIENEFLYIESLDDGTERVVAELNGCFSSYTELKDQIDRLIDSKLKEHAE